MGVGTYLAQIDQNTGVLSLAREIAESFRTGDAASGKKAIDKLGLVGMAESLLVVVTILFMVFKWGGYGG